MNKIKIWNDLLKLPIDEIKKITLELRLIEIVRMLDQESKRTAKKIFEEISDEIIELREKKAFGYIDQDKYLKLKERWIN